MGWSAGLLLVTTGAGQEPGINGGLLKRQHPGMGTVNTVQVTSLDQTVAQIEKQGGRTVVPEWRFPVSGILPIAATPKTMCLV